MRLLLHDIMSGKQILKGKIFSGPWRTRLAILLVVAGMISGLATYVAFTSTGTLGSDPKKVLWLLNINLIIVLLLMTLVARRVASLFSGRKRGAAGSRLHVRLVFIFCFLAATPAILMTLFSGFFLHFGVNSWFNDQVFTAVTKSQAVAEAYLEEHQQVIRADALAMAGDIDVQAPYIIGSPKRFEKVMDTQSLLRNFSEAIVLDKDERVIARSGLTFALSFEAFPNYAIPELEANNVVVMTGGNDDRVRALVKLKSLDAYLYVGRMVDPVVLGYLSDTKKAVEQYTTLEAKRSDLQIKITLIFIVIALLLLFGAMWFGLTFSRELVSPISDLIKTADRVRSGDLTARVPNFSRKDEFDILGRTFNRMTAQIQDQRDELVNANRQLDQRRQFTETVLSGVSSGVIAIDQDGAITIANDASAQFLDIEMGALISKPLTDIFPNIVESISAAYEKPGKVTEVELPFIRQDGAKRTLLIRIAIDKNHTEEQRAGAVITFEDITELQSAQRKAAWADVARRIAHEIKNPLTPIQLSAERLRRKYLNEIQTDPEVFSACTETIIQHVGDIGHMVNEFSSFARMPEARPQYKNISRSVSDIILMQKEAHTDIDFNFEYYNKTSPAQFTTSFDEQQLRQAFINIVQNSIDSIYMKAESEPNDYKGHIDIILGFTPDQTNMFISIADNGLGLPKEHEEESLTEPYVTHKPKGTGLGLAIVKKIMDDHNGKLLLKCPSWLDSEAEARDGKAAIITLILPMTEDNSQESVA
jgi:two-component system nitrogen regulation sensor histidine kinase NtrY